MYGRSEATPPKIVTAQYARDVNGSVIGVEEGTVIASAHTTGQSTIGRHTTGTSVSDVAELWGIRREGFTLFIKASPKQPGRLNMAELRKRLERT